MPVADQAIKLLSISDCSSQRFKTLSIPLYILVSLSCANI